MNGHYNEDADCFHNFIEQGQQKIVRFVLVEQKEQEPGYRGSNQPSKGQAGGIEGGTHQVKGQ